MSLDPKTQAVLDKMLASGTSDWDRMTPAQVRQAFGGAGGDGDERYDHGCHWGGGRALY